MHNRTIKILIVDANPAERLTYRGFLGHDATRECIFFEAESAAQALTLFQSEKPDCILLDTHLPDREGVDLLSDFFIRGGTFYVPVVMLSGQGNEMVAVKALQRGAQEYVIKGTLDSQTLWRAVHNAIEKVLLRSRLERQTEELGEKNREFERISKFKSEFLANMSHELRTPINGVLGANDLLLSTDLTMEQRDYAETVRTSADALLNLVNDILDFAKFEAGKLRLEIIDFDLPKLMSDVTRPLALAADQKGIGLYLDLAPEVAPHLKGDPTRVGQILNNLIGNAVKFTATGDVRLRVKLVQSNEASQRLRFEVVDTGIGMGKSQLGQMFQEFSQADVSTTRKYGGTGLGLAICKRLVGLMGGEIDVESSEGQGSTFWFELPFELASGSPVDVPDLPTAARSVHAGKIRVLLAEDNPVNQKIALKMLSKLGFEADVAGTGKAALLALEKKSYGLVLMDCQMPEMDGYQATRAIRQHGNPAIRSLPIVAMTAHAMKGDREKCVEAGMDEYLTKPIRMQALLATIQRTLEGRTDPDEVETSPVPIASVETYDREELLESLDGDEGAVKEIVELYLSSAPEMISALSREVESANAIGVADAAHAIRGALLMLRAHPAAAVANELEQSSRQGNLTNVKMKLAALDTAAQQLAVALVGS